MLELEGNALRKALERCCGSRAWIDAMEKSLMARGTRWDEALLF